MVDGAVLEVHAIAKKKYCGAGNLHVMGWIIMP